MHLYLHVLYAACRDCCRDLPTFNTKAHAQENVVLKSPFPIRNAVPTNFLITS